MEDAKTYLVSGAAGFLGSNFVHYLLSTYADVHVLSVDDLSSGSRQNLEDLEDGGRHMFVQVDIGDSRKLDRLFIDNAPDYVVNFATRRRKKDPTSSEEFSVAADIEGLQSLIQVAQHDWEEFDGGYGSHRFVQVSTGAVYGQCEKGAPDFTEQAPLLPGNPWAAAKAGADLLAMSYRSTCGFPVNIVRCGNCYGPWQGEEQLVAGAIASAIKRQPIPLCSRGTNVCSWTYSWDACAAIDAAVRLGRSGNVYNIDAGDKVTDAEMVRAICGMLGKRSFTEPAQGDNDFERFGSMDSSKARQILGWQPRMGLGEGLAGTVTWYKQRLDNKANAVYEQREKEQKNSSAPSKSAPAKSSRRKPFFQRASNYPKGKHSL